MPSQVDNPSPSYSAASLAPAKSSAPAEKQPAGGPPDAILLAYMFIFDSVLTKNETAQRQAKELQTNANEQNQLINVENGFAIIGCSTSAGLKQFLDSHEAQFKSELKTWIGIEKDGHTEIVWCSGTKPFDYKVQLDVLNGVQTDNQYTTAVRSLFENKITVARQSAQMGETDLNTNANETSEAIQQGGNLMQMLISLTNQITKI